MEAQSAVTRLVLVRFKVGRDIVQRELGAAVAQRAPDPKVGGSNPLVLTILPQ